MIVIVVIYMVKHYQKKKDIKGEMMENVHQPLLSTNSSIQYSFYDSIHSWTLTSSIVRAARRFTTSMSVKAFGHKEGM